MKLISWQWLWSYKSTYAIRMHRTTKHSPAYKGEPIKLENSVYSCRFYQCQCPDYDILKSQVLSQPKWLDRWPNSRLGSWGSRSYGPLATCGIVARGGSCGPNWPKDWSGSHRVAGSGEGCEHGASWGDWGRGASWDGGSGDEAEEWGRGCEYGASRGGEEEERFGVRGC